MCVRVFICVSLSLSRSRTHSNTQIHSDTFARLYHQRLLSVAPEAADHLSLQGLHAGGPGLGRVGKWVVQQRRLLLDSMQSMAMEQFTQWLVCGRGWGYMGCCMGCVWLYGVYVVCMVTWGGCQFIVVVIVVNILVLS